MKVLVINCGSSSLKYQLIDMNNENALSQGVVERIGVDGAFIKFKNNGEKGKEMFEISDHQKALSIVLDNLKSNKVIDSFEQIDAVGHRVVHGGEEFSESVKIDEDVIEGIKRCVELAPLHNPANLIGIEAMRKVLPDTPMVAVFDTAFHQTMSQEAYLYPIPYEFYQKYKIRKYGFHGTSHKYVSQRTAQILGEDVENLNIIVCHLGQGASICAVEAGKSINTSMGMTPLSGLIMGTRSGDIDPAIISFLMDKESLSEKEVLDILNKKSGVLGISGISNDFRDLEEEAFNKNNLRAQLALDKFHLRVRKYIGSFAVLMDRVDSIVFTAGVGENGFESREDICEGLKTLGVQIDKQKNNVRGKEAVISTQDSKVKVLVVPTNEELMIARDTKDILKL